jgi:hypothetical protein
LTGDKSCEKLAFSLGMAAYFSSINFAGSCKLSRHWPEAFQLHLFEFIHWDAKEQPVFVTFDLLKHIGKNTAWHQVSNNHVAPFILS